MPEITPLKMRHRLRTTWFASALVALAVGFAGPTSAGPAINTTADNVAIKGYDTVAYFADGKATKGSPDHQVTWQDANWYFATAEHRKLFEADPSRYAPQFGGWCAAGVAAGAYYDVDAETWAIVGGKLYLNHNQKVAKRWAEDRDGKIAEAEKIWAAKTAGN